MFLSRNIVLSAGIMGQVKRDMKQSRNQEIFSGRVQKFSWGQRTERTGIWGR